MGVGGYRGRSECESACGLVWQCACVAVVVWVPTDRAKMLPVLGRRLLHFTRQEAATFTRLCWRGHPAGQVTPNGEQQHVVMFIK